MLPSMSFESISKKERFDEVSLVLSKDKLATVLRKFYAQAKNNSVIK